MDPAPRPLGEFLIRLVAAALLGALASAFVMSVVYWLSYSCGPVWIRYDCEPGLEWVSVIPGPLIFLWVMRITRPLQQR